MKESFYFPHYYGARNDDKLLELRARFNGAEGYGIFWMILETMAENSDGRLNANLIGGLSIGYGVPINTLQAILDFCIEIGLFIREGDTIFSQKMLSHKNDRKALSEAGKRGAEKRWKNSHPIATPIARKERKGNNTNINISIYRQFAHLSISQDEFQKLITLGFSKVQIDEILDQIENYKGNTKYKSLFLTTKNWLEKSSAKKEKQSHERDRDNFTF